MQQEQQQEQQQPMAHTSVEHVDVPQHTIPVSNTCHDHKAYFDLPDSDASADRKPAAVTAAAGGGEDSIDPPAPGMMAMPPRTLAAQRVIDRITHTAPTAMDVINFMAEMRAFRTQSKTQLSPIQSVWQQGEFVRLALEANQLAMASQIATVFIRSLPHASVESALFAGPGRSLFLDTFGNPEATGAPTLQGVDTLVFLAYYMPLCPDLDDSLALLKQIVRTVAPSVSPAWISRILQADDYQFYIFKFTPNFSNWFHVMRRDHTLAAATWLLGPEQPLPVVVTTRANSHNIPMIYALENAPLAIRDLILSSILHTQTRAVILLVRAAIVRGWENPVANRALPVIDQHLAMHAPSSRIDLLDDSQHHIMRNLTEQMSRNSTAEGGVPFDVAGLVMDYVRRDDSVRATVESRLTPYKQREDDYLRARIGEVGELIAEEQVAGAPPRSSPAAARHLPVRTREEEEEDETERQLAVAHAAATAARW